MHGHSSSQELKPPSDERWRECDQFNWLQMRDDMWNLNLMWKLSQLVMHSTTGRMAFSIVATGDAFILMQQT